MNVLIIGSGGREHAIAWKLRKDDISINIIAIPGNGGISEIAGCVDADTGDIENLADIAETLKADYTIVGPEVPLSAGISDVFQGRGLKIFGPGREGSRLESSKIFAKEFMEKYNIPTARFQVAESFEEGADILERRKYPSVLKYDGLAAGKGVKVAESKQEAVLFLEEVYRDRVFGGDGNRILVEDCLTGRELSYLVFTDTESFAPMVAAVDHKRVFDGDKGPNTGGMGCYSPPFFFDSALEETIKERIVIPTLGGLRKEKIDYRGVLYFGLMLTDEGPYVLEYNVRFGDPETQVILPRMESSLLEAVDGVIEKKLGSVRIKWSEKKAVCVILASGGYPGKYQKGRSIRGLGKAEGVILFHAGTERKGDGVITSGGRVLGITAVDRNIERARKKVYSAILSIDFEGKHYRKDIGLSKNGNDF